MITYRNSKLHKGTIWRTADSLNSLQKVPIRQSVTSLFGSDFFYPSNRLFFLIRSTKKYQSKQFFTNFFAKETRDLHGKSELNFLSIRCYKQINKVQCKQYEQANKLQAHNINIMYLYKLIEAANLSQCDLMLTQSYHLSKL